MFYIHICFFLSYSINSCFIILFALIVLLSKLSIDILFSRHMNLNFLLSLDFMGKRRKSERLNLIRKNSPLKPSFWCDIATGSLCELSSHAS